MQSSILIARLLGPLLVVAGLTMLANPKDPLEVARQFLASRALIYLAGILALLAGLAIVNTHNLWVADWPVVITLFGWLAILGGILRIGFPALTKSIGEKMLARPSQLRIIGLVQAALGVFLMYVAYAA